MKMTALFLTLLGILTLSACAGDPPQRNPYNDPDTQRARSSSAQDDLSDSTR